MQPDTGKCTDDRAAWSIRRTGLSTLCLAALASMLAGCSGAGNGFMAPAGEIAGTERQMFFEIAIVTLIVIIPVFVLTPWVIWRQNRKRAGAAYDPDWDSSRLIEALMWGVPVLIVAALAAFTWIRTHQLDPYTELAGGGEPVDIQVVALDWKWLFIYPEEGFATVNEMAIPVGRPINLKLTSGTVMQSFHVPKLAGQVYTMAGMTTELSLRATETGEFIGRNTQYSGDGFAQQHFPVHALSETDYQRWISRLRSNGKTLDEASFLMIAEPSVADNPQYFSSVSPDLFDRILYLSTRANAPLGATPRHNTEEKNR